MNIILFDCHTTRENLLPFTYTRPVADIRLGITTIREKWERNFGTSSCSLTEDYLYGSFAPHAGTAPALYINGAVLPDEILVQAIRALGALQSLVANGKLIAFKSEKQHLNYQNFEAIAKGYTTVDYLLPIQSITCSWDIFQMNGQALQEDFAAITKGRKSQPLSISNTVIGPPENIFLEEGAIVEACILNTTTGPVYIGQQSELMEGVTVRGPLALGHHSTLKMGAKVYGPTTLGPHCKAGGELNNVVMFGYSNKAHDGFLGNSVIGEWCNLGADTNNSNLKNNYSEVEVFNYREGKAVNTGLQFCGLLMGDHSKCGINTMFNTGTVVGVSSNIFGADFPPKFIPSFSWGGAAWLRTFTFDKAMEVANRMMERRGLKMEDAEVQIMKTIFERDEKYRKENKKQGA